MLVDETFRLESPTKDWKSLICLEQEVSHPRITKQNWSSDPPYRARCYPGSVLPISPAQKNPLAGLGFEKGNLTFICSKTLICFRWVVLDVSTKQPLVDIQKLDPLRVVNPGDVAYRLMQIRQKPRLSEAE